MTVVCIALCVVIAAIEIVHAIERRDLYNRIQSKDYKEYKASGVPPKRPESRHDQVLKKWRKKGDNT